MNTQTIRAAKFERYTPKKLQNLISEAEKSEAQIYAQIKSLSLKAQKITQKKQAAKSALAEKLKRSIEWENDIRQALWEIENGECEEYEDWEAYKKAMDLADGKI